MSDLQACIDAIERELLLPSDVPVFRNWIARGSPADLGRLSRQKHGWIDQGVLQPLWADDSIEFRRVLAALVNLEWFGVVGHWIRARVGRGVHDRSLFADFANWGMQWELRMNASCSYSVHELCEQMGRPTVEGEWYLAREDWPHTRPYFGMIQFAVDNGWPGVERWLARDFAGGACSDRWEHLQQAVAAYGQRFLPLAKSTFDAMREPTDAWSLASTIAIHEPAMIPEAITQAWKAVRRAPKSRYIPESRSSQRAMQWLKVNDAANVPKEALDWARTLVSSQSKSEPGWAVPSLRELLSLDDRLVVDAMTVLLRSRWHCIRLVALQYFASEASDPLFLETVRLALDEARKFYESPGEWPGFEEVKSNAYYRSKPDASCRSQIAKEACETIALLDVRRTSLLIDDLRRLFEHPATAVRTAAANAIVKLGAQSLPIFIDSLDSMNKDGRLAAAKALTALGTPEALAAMEARIDAEKSDEVRDAMLAAIDPVWQRSGRVFTRAEVDSRVARIGKALDKPIAKWLDLDAAPALTSASGPFDPRWTRFICWRQSRDTEIALAPECRPFVELVDRAKSGEFAMHVLSAFLASKQEAKDRWALAIVGILGDDRVAKSLRTAVDQWAQKGRGAMAEYAAIAISLIGTDRALQQVDDIANAYRSNRKNIGEAAAAAFEAVAAARGMTTDELGDSVVPRLSFASGTTRELEAKGKPFTVRVGADGKLSYREAGKDKSSPPSGIAAELKKELKELAAALREAIKIQTRRHARMLVQQRRWPASKWAELYIGHPVLIPYLTQLVWAHYESGAAPSKLFRGMADGTLTDADDNPVTIPTTGHIGLVHPLELTEDQLAAWRQHLSDYEIVPPFPQLDRPIIRATAEESNAKVLTFTKGVKLNALTFKGRADRFGWRRGSVADAGSVSSFYKSFPASNVEAVLALEQFYVAASVDDEADLGEAFFVTLGTVRRGSYEYDDPQGESDPRVLPMHQVPPIVFSEAVAELRAITGKAAEAEEE
jgi:hypothetical protein